MEWCEKNGMNDGWSGWLESWVTGRVTSWELERWKRLFCGESGVLVS